jgi:hypothetical protein
MCPPLALHLAGDRAADKQADVIDRDGVCGLDEERDGLR